jgi:cytochrome c oxidase subunit IV
MAHDTADSRTEHERVGRAAASRYWIIWILLLALTVATFLLSRIHLVSPFNLLVALVIACTKSALVVLFFMHLWDHGGANRIVFVTSIFFVVLLVGLVVLDNATRFVLLNPGRGATLQLEPPGPDVLSPRYPPEPGARPDLPSAVEPGRNVPGPPPGR